MKKLALITMAIQFGTVLAQNEVPVAGKVTTVTMFLRKAQVTREIKTRVEEGSTNLVLQGLSAHIDTENIQVTGKGNITILGVAHRQNFLSEFNLPKPLQQLKDSVDLLRRRLAMEETQKEILVKEEQLLLSNQKIGGTNTNLTVAELKAMADFYRSRLSDIALAKMKQDEKIQRLTEKKAKAERQFQEGNELYRRNTSEIVIQVSAQAPTSANLEVRYVVAQAGWIPVYDLRATDASHPVELSYKANVFQQTGEDWNNVRLKLSTANPLLGGLKPELHPWYVDIDQPVVLREVANYKSEKRKSAMADAAAPEMLEEAETVAEFTEVVETTLNTEFDIAIPYSVPSSPKPTQVDIQRHTLEANYKYAVAPKLDFDAFLIAEIRGWDKLSLLPGDANIFFDGTYVARTRIEPRNIADTLSLSLGRDKRIVVKRERVKDYTSRRILASNIKDNHTYEISIRNTRTQAVALTVEDQIPLSRNSQIEVELTDKGGAVYNKTTGMLSWSLTLQPNESKKLTYSFDVKYPKDKVISGL